MKTFQYRGFDLSGQLARGLVEALDVKEARERLTERGILPERVVEAGVDRRFGASARAPGVGARAMFYREMGALLHAGVPMVAALDIVIHSTDAPAHAFALARARDRVREGASLTDALSVANERLPEFEKAALIAGERAGTLDGVLDRLADHMEEKQKTQERLISALIYPAFVVLIAIVIGIGLMGFALPNLGRMFADTNVPLPWLTRCLMAMGNNAFNVVLPLAAVVMVVAGLVIRGIARNAAQRERFDRLLFRWPIVGRNLRLLVNARFAQTFALLMRGGVGVVEAMEMAGAATGNRWLSGLLRGEAHEVRHGKTITQAIKSVPPFRHALAGWMEAGEASGNLPELMDRAGARFQQQWNQHLTRCMNILEPLLIVIVGVFVLLIALAVLLPILSLNQTLAP